MDFTQRKLTKKEWESIEIAVSKSEQEILQMIVSGYNDLDYKYNKNCTLMTFMKINYEESIEQYLYTTYFMNIIEKLIKKYNLPDSTFQAAIDNKIKAILKKSDIIRLESNKVENIQEKNEDLYEYVLLDLAEKLLKYQTKGKDRFVKFYYTLSHIIDSNIHNPNIFVVTFIKNILQHFQSEISLEKLVISASSYIEENPYLLQYADIQLYNHQKEIFKIFNKNDHTCSTNPKLILYVAPTATGKTMSPLGLSVNHRVIFVCAARHVGLALAKSALGISKKVAFAFGCSSCDDIRLHYFATNSFVKNNQGNDIRLKSGMKKTDHSDGSKVEIMICDIQSYIHAMYYMSSFHDKNTIITFWDEPTISLDYEEHENHHLINEVWSNNIIPNIVLSSATLPSQEELYNVVRDFKIKFEGGRIYNVSSSDCKKTIPLLNQDGQVIMPHLLESLEHSDVRKIIIHIQENPTLMRYLDLHEVGRFIKYILKNKILEDNEDANYNLENYFPNIHSITMENLKTYYIEVLSLLDENQLSALREYFMANKQQRIGESGVKNAGMYISTKDAYTLTDGPTIFMTKNPEAIGKFCIQQANIPTQILEELNQKILYNTQLGKKMLKLENQIEDMSTINDGSTNNDKNKSSAPKFKDTKEIANLEKELAQIQSLLKTVNIDPKYIPNSKQHQEKWIQDKILKAKIEESTSQPYFHNVDESQVKDIMELGNVEHIWKLLLIMGIGMFSENISPQYLEIMKSMAEKQQLLIIIATDDYIYGTNYQFCHGYISKDLSSMTQEKIIQALGRVGRNNIQQNYSIRFRTADIIKRVFYPEEDKIEVRNMNKLFVTNE